MPNRILSNPFKTFGLFTTTICMVDVSSVSAFKKRGAEKNYRYSKNGYKPFFGAYKGHDHAGGKGNGDRPF